MNPYFSSHPTPHLRQEVQGYWRGTFDAMASPCEVLFDGPSLPPAWLQTALTLVATEAWRIEHKYSRYQPDNIVATINGAAGAPVTVDPETAQLLDFAAQCFQLSDGLFDITSGILRRAWQFSSRVSPLTQTIPQQEHIDALLPLIGWQRCTWQAPQLTLPAGMEIDFGGLGKEYAVDRCLQKLQAFAASSGIHDGAFLINFGGDIACSGRRPGDQPWHIGLQPNLTASPNAGAHSTPLLELRQGAVATSGDTYRFIDYQGQRLSHILNPFTGWPIVQAPQTVTVASLNCVHAGMLATFAMLFGKDAESFLQEQGVQLFNVYRR